MSIEGQGHSLTLVKSHSDFKVKCLTFGLYTQVSDSGPLGPLVYVMGKVLSGELSCPCDRSCSVTSQTEILSTETSGFLKQTIFLESMS